MILLSREEQRSLLARAYLVATQSRDPSTQMGAVVITYKDGVWKLPTIIGEGYNTFPDGIAETPERLHDRRLKYKYMVHAERHAIERARRALNTMDLHRCILVCPWACCSSCAQDIIHANIPQVLIHHEAHERTPAQGPWMDDIPIGHGMLREKKVSIGIFKGKIFDEALGSIEVRHSGTVWVP